MARLLSVTEATEQGVKLSPLDILFGFDGRVGIGTFWSYFMTVWVAGFALGVSLTFMDRSLATGVAVLLYVATAYLSASLIAKRLQDSGRHAALLVFVLVPLVGLVWLIILGASPTDSANEYGPEAGYRYKTGEGLLEYKATTSVDSQSPPPLNPTPPLNDITSGASLVEQLERISSLHASGQLTDDEFHNMKRLLIPEQPSA